LDAAFGTYSDRLMYHFGAAIGPAAANLTMPQEHRCVTTPAAEFYRVESRDI
jgi:hypothetical protein